MKKKLIAGILAVLVVVGGVTAGLLLRDDGDSAKPRSEPVSGDPASEELDPGDPELDVAESKTREDSMYPNVGDPRVDALHYDLNLTWDPEESELTGTARIIFRSTATAESFQLDFAKPLEVTGSEVDGQPVETSHVGKDLVVEAPVTADQRYVLDIEYSGSPKPYAAPTTRSDFDEVGWTVTDEGEVWTMQEPYGAFTWYPVNDQPADKALYDFTITTPESMVGVANGELLSREVVDEQTTTTFSMDAPASSYLITIAIGDFEMTEDTSQSGVPLTYWTPSDDSDALQNLQVTADAMTWLEDKLGPYPFERLGSVVVDSQSAMETQTLITYGNNDYALSPPVIVHEMAHHWYGDIVSPTDWRDVWMNEGMAMYLQWAYEAEQSGGTVENIIELNRSWERQSRAENGPPGDYDPTTFGQNNIYYGPAMMWHQVRKRVGDKAFWEMVRAWPTVHAEGNATRKQYLTWVEKETGTELTSLFRAWLMGEKSPRPAKSS